MSHDFMRRAMYELLREQKAIEQKEKRELEVKNLEAEQAEIERLEREKNAVVDFCFSKKTDQNEGNYLSVEINKLRDNNFDDWVKETCPVLGEMRSEELAAILKKRNPRLWGTGFSDWRKTRKDFKLKKGRPNKTRD